MLFRRLLAPGALTVAVLLGQGVAQAVPAAPTPEALAAVSRSIAAPLAGAHARTGALALSTDPLDGQTTTLLARNTASMLPPASTTKLLTAGAALQLLGADHRFTTTVTTTVAPDEAGVVQGDLVLTGAGDPTLRRADLQRLAADVAAAGITQVTGQLVVDDTLFDRQRGALGWRHYYVGEESGPLSALMVDHNLWRRDAAFRANPVPADRSLFAAALTERHVVLSGAVATARPTVELLPVAHHDSDPLAGILRHTLQQSDNTEAEVLLKHVGVAGGAGGSTQGGLAVVRALAGQWGVTLHGRIVDGSGLSRLDRLDVASMVAWLQALDANGLGDAVRAALPVSCRTGTLKRRLCGSWLSGRATAKTGTLDHTAALAGWTTTRSGRPTAFAVVVDGPWASRARAALDTAVARLMRSTL